MYPVPAHAKQVIAEWADELAHRFACDVEVVRGPSLRWLSFPSTNLRLELMDGSHVDFCYAFHLVSETRKAIAVFTEHCGHHVFPFHEAKVLANGMLLYAQGDA